MFQVENRKPYKYVKRVYIIEFELKNFEFWKQTQSRKNIQRKGRRSMIIEDMEQSLELLKDINYFFINIDEIDRKLKTELHNKEWERDDLLHEIELSKLSIGERSRTYSHLEKVLKERRVIKDKIELINTIRPYTSKFITKGICAETKQTIENVNRLKKHQETRKYTPRILKDLKCAKKKEE